MQTIVKLREEFEPIVFNASKRHAWLGIGFSLLIPVFGFRLLLASAAMLRGTVTVDGFGVTKSPERFYGFRAAWSEIESWEDGVVNWRGHDPADLDRCVFLRIRGRAIPVRITKYDAYQPDIQLLVDGLTSILGEPTGV